MGVSLIIALGVSLSLFSRFSLLEAFECKETFCCNCFAEGVDRVICSFRGCIPLVTDYIAAMPALEDFACNVEVVVPASWSLKFCFTYI